jgi:hypothetical protein
MNDDELEQWFEANKTILARETGLFASIVSRETLAC